MRTAALAVLLLFTTSVMASGYGRYGPTYNQFGGKGVGIGVGTGIGTGYGGAGGQGGSVHVPRQHRFAAMAYAPSIQPSSDCRNPFNIGGSGPMAGISAGWTYEDTQCRVTETMRVLGSLKWYGVLPDDIDGLITHATCKLEVLADSPFCKANVSVMHKAAAEEGIELPTKSAAVTPVNGPERKFTLFGLLD